MCQGERHSGRIRRRLSSLDGRSPKRLSKRVRHGRPPWQQAGRGRSGEPASLEPAVEIQQDSTLQAGGREGRRRSNPRFPRSPPRGEVKRRHGGGGSEESVEVAHHVRAENRENSTAIVRSRERWVLGPFALQEPGVSREPVQMTDQSHRFALSRTEDAEQRLAPPGLRTSKEGFTLPKALVRGIPSRHRTCHRPVPNQLRPNSGGPCWHPPWWPIS